MRTPMIILPNVRNSGLIHKELKFKDIAYADWVGNSVAAANADPSPQLSISGVAQGDGPNTRDGRRYMVRHLLIKGKLTLIAKQNAATVPNDVTVRLVIFKDTQTNAAVPSPNDVFDNYSVSPDLSFRNLEFTQRYKVMLDKLITITRETLSEASGPTWSCSQEIRNFKFYFKDINMLVNTVGTADTIGAIADNSLHVMCWCDDAVAQQVYLDYNVRIRFQD